MRTFLARLRLTFADLLVFLGHGARDTLTGLRNDLGEIWRWIREWDWGPGR